MKKRLFILLIICISCQEKSVMETEFSCNTSINEALEEIVDVKKLFSVQFPKHWKTNLYYDELQSSIYTGDTTKQLTETILIDVTFIRKSIQINEAFKLKNEQESLANQLIQFQSKEITLANKPSYYSLSKGRKNNFPYQNFNLFIQVSEENFIHAKTEIYGDSLVNKRLCNAIQLLEKIKIQ